MKYTLVPAERDTVVDNRHQLYFFLGDCDAELAYFVQFQEANPLLHTVL